jgi:predicted Zn finger-like uncharacterized protein
MNVRCPHCATDYLLPDRLLGPRGARVRCPRCGRPFEVSRDAEVQEAVVNPPPSSPDEPGKEPGPPSLEEPPEQVAARLFDQLEDRLGPAITAARDQGRLWSEHGHELMRAWDDYCQALGERADVTVFRAALRARWDVDLGPGAPAESER